MDFVNILPQKILRMNLNFYSKIKRVEKINVFSFLSINKIEKFLFIITK